MATAYGNVIHHWQAYVDAYVSSETETTATVTCKTYWHSIAWGYQYYGNGHGVIGSTTGASSGTVVFRSTNGATVNQLLTTMTQTYTKTGSTQTVTCRAVVTLTGDGTGTRNGTSTASVNVTIPATATSAPNAPSSCSSTRNSDALVTTTWTNGTTTTAKPRTATLVERQVDDGSWAQVASIGSSVTSYADNGVAANHRYRYRVRAKNTAGTSSYATSGYVYTTPAAPTSVTLAKTSVTVVQVDVDGSMPYATGYDVQRTTDGGATWADVASGASMPYTDIVSGGTVQYRVRSVRGSLASAYTCSESLATITAPNAPTIVMWPTATVPVGETLQIIWMPNHPDGTEQTAAQVDVDGITTEVSGSETRAVVTSDEGTHTARVRTKGLDDDWGAWSEPVTWQAAYAPVITITSPAVDGAVITELPITVSWNAADSTGTSAQVVTITDDGGATVYRATPDTSVTTMDVHSYDAAIANGANYTITVTVTGGSGLTASATRAVSTNWAEPNGPYATIDVDDTSLTCVVTVYAGNGTPATERMVVTRVSPDGERWLMADWAVDGTTIVDPLPPLGVEFSYEIMAVAVETGATTVVTYTELVEGARWALNCAQGAALMQTFEYNPTSTWSMEHGGEVYHFADGGEGKGLPVFYPTESRNQSGTLSFHVIDRAEVDTLIERSTTYPVMWLRDPLGHRWRAHVTPSHSREIGPFWRVSIRWDAVRWEEAR